MSQEINGNKSWSWRGIIAGLCTAIFTILTFVLLILDRSASAAVSAAMTGASVLLLFLPFVDTIEVFGLKAKLNKQIDESEQLLNRLRDTVAVLAKPIFIQAAYGNRWGGVPVEMQRENLAEVEQMLREIGISDTKIAESRAPVPAMQSWDFVSVLSNTIRFLVAEKQKKIEDDWQEKNKGKAVDQNDPAYKAYLDKRNFLSECIPQNTLAKVTELKDIKTLIETKFSEAKLSETDRNVLKAVVEEVINYSNDCWKNGFITDDGHAYLESYSTDQGKRFKELKESNPDWNAAFFDQTLNNKDD